ncbi:MAG: ribosomal protein S18 acetylase RimI-like enzyme [Oceanospirillaceae bacterium]|jgi:ribosomal protein S18 acetylase RimI-like enzyme
MKIIYKNVTVAEKDTAFRLFKTYMQPIIDKEIGWDESLQRSGFYDNYQTPWLYWVIIDSKKIGLVCLREKARNLHIHLIIVFEQFQRRGYGQYIITQLQNSLNPNLLGMTLSSFKSNVCALNLYKTMGFTVVAQDKYFYNLACQVADY